MRIVILSFANAARMKKASNEAASTKKAATNAANGNPNEITISPKELTKFIKKVVDRAIKKPIQEAIQKALTSCPIINKMNDKKVKEAVNTTVAAVLCQCS